MLRKETHYCWRILAEVEGETGPRLLVPNSDPNEYEQPMDLLFDSPQKAYDVLSDYGVAEQAIEENWLLCTQVVEVVEEINSNKVKLDDD